MVSSGDGGLYPSDILIGRVATGADGRQRVQLAADYRRLDFVRVVRATSLAPIDGPVELIGPTLPADASADAPAVARAEARAMSRPRALPPLIEKAIFLGLGVVAVEAALIPLGPGSALVAPDLLFGLVVAWVIRRPATAPLWAVRRARALRRPDDVAPARARGAGADARLGVVPPARGALPGGALPARVAGDGAGLRGRCSPGCSCALALVFADGPGLAALARYARHHGAGLSARSSWA